MLSRIGVAPRRPGLDVHEFQSHWRSRHASLASKLPGVRRYWQNHAVLQDGEPLLPWPGFDACSDFEFDDMPSIDTAFASPQYTDGVREDEAYLVDKPNGGFILADYIHKEGEIDGKGIRLLTFFRAAPLRTVSELHVALRQMPTARHAKGHELFLALDGARAAQRTNIFDAVDSQWFESTKAVQAHLISSEAREHRHAFAGLVRGTERLVAEVFMVI